MITFVSHLRQSHKNKIEKEGKQNRKTMQIKANLGINPRLWFCKH